MRNWEDNSCLLDLLENTLRLQFSKMKTRLLLLIENKKNLVASIKMIEN